MTIRIPDPRDIDLDRWCAELILQDASVPNPPDLLGWRRWAAAVIQFSSLASYNLPDPGQFSTWRAWATRVREVVPG